MGKPDAVELELFRYAASSVVDEIEANLTRTAYSPLIYEYKDYCVAVLDRDFRLVTQSRGSLPIFLGDLGAPVRDAVEVLGQENLVAGDVFINNYTPICGQHINNVVMATPMFVDGVLHGYVAIRAHWADLGGLVPGSMSWNATDVHQEGLQVRGLMVLRGGVIDRGALATIQANTRMPEYVTGDLFAQVGGCEKGVARWNELISSRWTIAEQNQLMQAQWTASRVLAESIIAEIPDGTYHSSCEMDDSGYPGTPPLEMKVAVVVAGSQMTIDLSGMPPQVSGPINAGGMGGGVTAARVAFKSIVAPERSADEGLFDCLDVQLREGSVISAGHNAPMGHWNTTLPTLIDLVMRAVGVITPERVPAGHHASMGVFQLHGQWDNGKWWQLVDTNLGGWGGNVQADGFSPLKTMFHGDNRDIPIEMVEARFPLRVDSYQFVPDSGGRGLHRGGLGTQKTISVLGDVILESGMDRTKEAAWGINGGESGRSGDIDVKGPDYPEWTSLKKATDITLVAGTTLRVRSGGGGGWGDPAERPTELIEQDLAMGWVTSEANR